MEKVEKSNPQSQFHMDQRRLSPDRKFNAEGSNPIVFDESKPEISPKRRMKMRKEQGYQTGIPKEDLKTNINVDLFHQRQNNMIERHQKKMQQSRSVDCIRKTLGIEKYTQFKRLIAERDKKVKFLRGQSAVPDTRILQASDTLKEVFRVKEQKKDQKFVPISLSKDLTYHFIKRINRMGRYIGKESPKNAAKNDKIVEVMGDSELHFENLLLFREYLDQLKDGQNQQLQDKNNIESRTMQIQDQEYVKVNKVDRSKFKNSIYNPERCAKKYVGSQPKADFLSYQIDKHQAAGSIEVLKDTSKENQSNTTFQGNEDVFRLTQQLNKPSTDTLKIPNIADESNTQQTVRKLDRELSEAMQHIQTSNVDTARQLYKQMLTEFSTSDIEINRQNWPKELLESEDRKKLQFTGYFQLSKQLKPLSGKKRKQTLSKSQIKYSKAYIPVEVDQFIQESARKEEPQVFEQDSISHLFKRSKSSQFLQKLKKRPYVGKRQEELPTCLETLRAYEDEDDEHRAKMSSTVQAAFFTHNYEEQGKNSFRNDPQIRVKTADIFKHSLKKKKNSREESQGIISKERQIQQKKELEQKLRDQGLLSVSYTSREREEKSQKDVQMARSMTLGKRKTLQGQHSQSVANLRQIPTKNKKTIGNRRIGDADLFRQKQLLSSRGLANQPEAAKTRTVFTHIMPSKFSESTLDRLDDSLFIN